LDESKRAVCLTHTKHFRLHGKVPHGDRSHRQPKKRQGLESNVCYAMDKPSLASYLSDKRVFDRVRKTYVNGWAILVSSFNGCPVSVPSYASGVRSDLPWPLCTLEALECCLFLLKTVIGQSKLLQGTGVIDATHAQRKLDKLTAVGPVRQ
jgi:hypothetical protein